MPGPLLAWVAAVALAGALPVGAATARIALDPPGLRTGLAIGLFLALALAAGGAWFVLGATGAASQDAGAWPLPDRPAG